MTLNVVGVARWSLPGLLFSMSLSACSPVFNWRDVTVAGDLVALLPCKPDRATRTLEIPGVERIAIHMTGCPAGDATFAISHADAESAAQAATWLAAWKASSRAQWPGALLTEAVTAVAGADPASSSRFTIVRTADGAGAKAAAQPDRAEILWFTRVTDAGRVSVYQAMVLGRPSADDAAATFFEGIRLSARRSPA
ncbi:MAG: hypothetical protein JWQ73_3067 [Variovorax sp.]|nr:hypothetical protein [Variovorax sp.]